MVYNIRRWLVGVFVLSVLFGRAPATLAESVATIVDNGDPANRVDIAVLGDGYTAGEMSKYANDVQQFIQGVFAQDPFKEYQGFFNVHRVDAISNESGADHPELTPPVYKDTAFDATYDCAGIQRLICVDTSKVSTVVSNSLSSSQHDIILVIVNDSVYGGSGGAVAVASTNSAAVDLILHETGHSFGLLADEYGGPPPPTCDASVEPSEPNATKETQRALIKWGSWIDPGTAIPTGSTSPGVPGLYQGAKYCDTGLFRPTYNSKMRSLGRPYEQINTEQLVKRIYNLVSPIDAGQPSTTSTVNLSQGQNQTFKVQTPQPVHALNFDWKVDGQTVGTSDHYTLISAGLTLGSHTVEVTVSDPTPLVRNDPAQVLQDALAWSVNVTAGSTHTLAVTKTGTGNGTVTSSPDGIDCGGICSVPFTAGSTVTLTATADAGSTFTSWSGDCSGSTSSTTVTMTAAKSCTATFTTSVSHSLNFVTVGSGTVTSNPPGLNCGANLSCVVAFPSGTTLTLLATPDSGFVFAGYTGDPDCTDGSVTLDADKSCAATFSGPTVGPDLTGTWGSLSQSCRTKLGVLTCTLRGQVTVSNQGNAPSSAASVLNVFLSSDGTTQDTLLTQVTVDTLSIGRTRRARLRVPLPAGTTASGKYVIAVIDATNTVLELAETNNVIVFGPIP